MKCQFCDAVGERLDVIPRYVRGLALTPTRVSVCPAHVADGLGKVHENLLGQARDLPRRRAILRLNQELKDLISADAPQEQINANRRKKTALVLVQKADSRDLVEALGMLKGAEDADAG